MTAYFYGVRPGDPNGHFCYGAHWARVPDNAPRSPWSSSLEPLSEGNTHPRLRVALGLPAISDHGDWRREQPEGAPVLVHDAGWTALCLWDRSADKRGGCTATFAFGVADLSLTEAVAVARVHFPGIIERIEAHTGRALGTPSSS